MKKSLGHESVIKTQCIASSQVETTTDFSLLLDIVDPLYLHSLLLDIVDPLYLHSSAGPTPMGV